MGSKRRILLIYIFIIIILVTQQQKASTQASSSKEEQYQQPTEDIAVKKQQEEGKETKGSQQSNKKGNKKSRQNPQEIKGIKDNVNGKKKEQDQNDDDQNDIYDYQNQTTGEEDTESQATPQQEENTQQQQVYDSLSQQAQSQSNTEGDDQLSADEQQTGEETVQNDDDEGSDDTSGDGNQTTIEDIENNQDDDDDQEIQVVIDENQDDESLDDESADFDDDDQQDDDQQQNQDQDEQGNQDDQISQIIAEDDQDGDDDNIQVIIPDKSINDNRQYQIVVLPNKLTVLYISSNTATKSSCAVSVGVGSLYNPQRSMGLAHFLQHMLFMGSQKYPGQNQYAKFIKSNSGSRNAFTSDTETNYYFQVKNSAFFQAFDRLINFFINPILREKSMEKERQAVQNQFSLRVSDDNRRKWQILRNLAEPPFSRFGTGNAETLSHDQIRQDLIDFYLTYYSANIMKVVVYSNSSIQQMKQQTISTLKQIQNYDLQLPQLGQHFTSEQKSKLVRMESIKDKAILQFFWIVEYLRPEYKSHVSEYISHVLRHEAQNSLRSILRGKNYVSQLKSQVQNLKSQTIISLELKLTKQGQQNYQQIYNIVMDFVQSLQFQSFIYDQIQQKNQVAFQNKQKTKPSTYAKKLATKMQYIPLPQLLNSTIVFADYQEAAQTINRFLGQLSTQNLILMLSSKTELQDPIVQYYFGVKYQVYDLPDRESSETVFGQIPQNPFIPIDTNFIQFQTATLIPSQIAQNYFLLQDSVFKVSKGGIQLRVCGEEGYLFINFYSKYLRLLLKQTTYPAQILSCSVKITAGDCLKITLFGYSDTVMRLLQLISQSISQIHDREDSEVLFQVVLNDLIQSYENYYNRKLNSLAGSILQVSLTKGLSPPQVSLQMLKQFQYDDITERIKNFWQKNNIKWVVVGNFDGQTITQLLNGVEKQLSGEQESNIDFPQYNPMQITDGLTIQVELESEHVGSSCAIVYYQAGPYNEDLNYRLQVIKDYINQPYFNQLRTNKKLAYSLGVKIQNIRGILGLRFILTSSTINPKQISDEIKEFVQKFMQNMEQDLKEQDEKRFQKMKQSVFAKNKSPPSNLKSFFKSISKQINENKYYFIRKVHKQINKYLDEIQIDDLVQTWDSMKDNTIQIYIVSKKHQEAYEEREVEAVNFSEVNDVKEDAEWFDDFFYCCI